jgi:hypothetical protein
MKRHFSGIIGAIVIAILTIFIYSKFVRERGRAPHAGANYRKKYSGYRR